MKSKITLFVLIAVCHFNLYSQQLVTDANPATKITLFGQEGIEYKGMFYFVAEHPTLGMELYRTDGTSNGTILFKDILPGSLWSMSQTTKFAIANNLLYFVASDSNNQGRLWRTDGTTAGTIQLGNSVVPYNTSLITLGNKLIFTANENNSGTELFVSNGTVIGTRIIQDLNTGSGSTIFRAPRVYNNTLFIHVGSTGKKLYKTTGDFSSATPITLVKDYNTISSSLIYSGRSVNIINNKLFIPVFDQVLDSGYFIISDGTTSGTIPMNRKWHRFINYVFPGDGTKFYFRTNTEAKLWVSNGTALGTNLLPGTIIPAALTNGYVNQGDLYFLGTPQGQSNKHLYRTDGIITTRIQDSPSTNFELYGGFYNIGAKLFFTAATATTGLELYVTEGQTSNTSFLKDINPGNSFLSMTSNPVLGDFNGSVYFIANEGISGNALWKSDGTSAGTILVKDIDGLTTNDGNPEATHLFKDQLVFSTQPTTNNYKALHITNGISGTSTPLYSRTPFNNSNLYPSSIYTDSNYLLFSAQEYDITSTYEKMEAHMSDGTLAGTRFKSPIPTAVSGTSAINYVKGYQGKYYFNGVNGNSPLTSSIMSIDYGVSSPNINNFNKPGKPQTQVFSFQDKIAYTASGGALKLFDPSNSSDILLSSVINGTDYYDFELVLNNKFIGKRKAGIYDEWFISNGTQTGTVRLNTHFSQSDGSHLYSDSCLYTYSKNFHALNRTGLWKINTETLNEELLFETKYTGINYLTKPNKNIYFFSSDSIYGVELWYNNGIVTRRLTDLVTDTGSFTPTGIVSIKDKAYFSGKDSTGIYSLWEVNDTVITKISTVDFETITHLRAHNNTLIFTGKEPIYGSEVWKQCIKNDNFYAGPDTNICQGVPFQLISQNGWSDSVLWNSSVTDSSIVTPSINVSFVATSFYGFGCETKDTFDLIVNQTPIVGATSNLDTICKGSGVYLRGTGADNYTWNKSVSDNVLFTPDSTDTYTVIGIDTTTGCSASTTIAVAVRESQISINFSDTSICLGDSVILFAENAFFFNWQSPVIDSQYFYPSSTQSYILSGSDNFSCFGTDTISIRVFENSQLSINASDTLICLGDSINLFASNASVINWQNGVINNQKFVPPVTSQYILFGKDLLGCTGKDTVLISVLDTATVVFDNSTFTISTPVLGATYQWLLNGLPIAGETSSSIIPQQNGNYSLILNNAACSDTSVIVLINSVNLSELTYDKVSVYPNPTNDIDYVNSDKILTISVLNLEGRDLLINTLNENSVDLSSLSSGMYILRIEFKNSEVVNKRIIKK